MGRPSVWTPQKLSPLDQLRGEIILKKYGPDLATKERVVKDFREFCRLNRLCREAAYAPFMGQMRD